MKLTDNLTRMSHDERIRAMARLEGMSLAMRIISNRATDLKDMSDSCSDVATKSKLTHCEEEAVTLRSIIRLVQVNIGNGTQGFGELTSKEVEEIMRIY